ncbi:DinB family protein [Sphingobacterium faecale]|uniref:DinB family protein n=1 Tax=Sphingobacterium faecale TaxID=2803775 RepID=A0ABS1R544_9SPHI|nr:DinB family protein [Sphingobacterium faecale]MBL1409820.1 DinB family protein [Sphingobacterium faecale]
MSLKQGFLIELERETENTRRIVSRLKDEHLDWRPHVKSMTAGELAAHVVELHNWVHKALGQSVFDFKKHYTPFKPTNMNEISEVLDQGYANNVEMINSLTDEDWSSMWTLCAGDHVIAEMPKVGAMRFIIQNHLIHHRGQLSLYLRLLDIPVPGIYGPSADDLSNG